MQIDDDPDRPLHGQAPRAAIQPCRPVIYYRYDVAIGRQSKRLELARMQRRLSPHGFDNRRRGANDFHAPQIGHGASRSPRSPSELRRHSRWDQQLEPVGKEIDVSQMIEVDRRPCVQGELPSRDQSRSGVQSRFALDVGRGARGVGVRMTASPVPLDRGPPVQPQALSGKPERNPSLMDELRQHQLERRAVSIVA
ncbi:MAG TPA: hypothetical protein VFA92_00105 [Candidatus Binatia bacterium]|nr:hypothetical protein [Candidatus Binatia bacterium]